MCGPYVACFALWLLARGCLASFPSLNDRERETEHYQQIHESQFIADGSSTSVEIPSLPLKATEGPALGGLLRAAASDGTSFVKHHKILSVAFFVGILLLAWSFKLSRDLDAALAGGDKDRPALNDSDLSSPQHEGPPQDPDHRTPIPQESYPLGPPASLPSESFSAPPAEVASPQPPASVPPQPVSLPPNELDTVQKSLDQPQVNPLPLQTRPAMAVSQQQDTRESFKGPMWSRTVLNAGSKLFWKAVGILGSRSLQAVNFMISAGALILELVLPSFWEQPDDDLEYEWQLLWPSKGN